MASQPPAESRRGPLIALAVIVVLVLGGWWLAQLLFQVGQVQDCAMAGRRNCAPIEAPTK